MQSTQVPYLNGSSRVDAELKMNLKNRRRNPTLTITHNSTQGRVSTALGQLLDRRLVHFTFFSRQVLDPGCRVLSECSFVVVTPCCILSLAGAAANIIFVATKLLS